MTPKKIVLFVGVYLLIAAIATIAYLADNLPDHPHTKLGWMMLFVCAPLYFVAEAFFEWIFERLGDFLTRTWPRIMGSP